MSAVRLRDGRPVTDMDMGLLEHTGLNMVLKRLKDTDLEKLLTAYGAVA